MSFRPIRTPDPEPEWPDSLKAGFAPYEKVEILHQLDFWVDCDGDVHLTDDGEKVDCLITSREIKSLLDVSRHVRRGDSQ